ncbi:hypothetical protein [Sphingorhabdus sp.]|uniref:hypothetical protein n=1 Tax=Sphingorhabdus sp. TaxID=1902408 RepID=UPI0032B7A3FB
MSLFASTLLFALQSTSSAAPATPPPSPCAAPEFSQFDFWVGEWDVYPNVAVDPKNASKVPLIANSRIEKLYAGCAIRENWMPLKGQGGGSLNGYNPATKRWHQAWIGAAPGHVDFDGGFTGGKMVLTGMWAGVNGPGQDALIRMSYTLQPDGSVRQHGEQSTDHGLTWSTNFDFMYRKRKEPIPAK